MQLSNHTQWHNVSAHQLRYIANHSRYLPRLEPASVTWYKSREQKYGKTFNSPT